MYLITNTSYKKNMLYTPRGKSLTEQRAVDYPTVMRMLEIVVDNKRVDIFFEYIGKKKIAIAAAGQLGKCLYKQLKNTDVKVECFFDKMHFKFWNGKCMDIPIYSYEKAGEFEEIDAFVVASSYYFNEIVDELVKARVPLEKILNINDVLFGMERLKK